MIDLAAEHSHQESRLTAFCSTIPGVCLRQYLFMLKIGKSEGFSHMCGTLHVFQIF